MVSASFLILGFVRIILTGVAFLIGYRFSNFRSSMEALRPCPPRQIIEYVPNPSSNVDILPKCAGPKIFDHCISSPFGDRTYLHHYAGNVPDEIFPFLHHPSLAAKSTLIMSDSPQWSSERLSETFRNNCNEIFLTRTGSRSNQPNKCVAIARVPEGVSSIVQHSHRYGYTALLTDQYLNDYARSNCFVEEQDLLSPFLLSLPKLIGMFKTKMGNPIDQNGLRRTAIIMVANVGVVDLLLNFLCSAEMAKIDLNSIMVFVGSKSDQYLVEQMGVHAMYDDALSNMPIHAAKGYLDNTFARMMWYKTTSVYLAVASGFDVLFQDVDLVWLQDPIPYLRSLDADISFMDDGARTPRYTPLFVNSGFFFIKNNERTVYFQEKMMKNAVAEIGYTHSHQSVLIRHLAETIHLLGLKVFVLDMELFPSGQAYHEKKKYIAKIINRTFKPYVFHMCWTDNRHNKVVYFKEIGLWYLPQSTQCNDAQSMLAIGSNSVNIRDLCCQREIYWKE